MPDTHATRIPQPAPAAAPPPRPEMRPADPCAMVIFGAGGDLTKRLVMPALYNLSRTKVLPENFAVIGVDLADGTAASWRDGLYDMLKSFVGNATAEFDIDRIDEAAWQRLGKKMSYIQGDLTEPGLYRKIGTALAAAEKTHGTEGNVIFYLAVADRFFGTVVEQLGTAKLSDQGTDKKHPCWRRVVIEKPFGRGLDSARALNVHIRQTLGEDQIFRIDHFLGKETVQNLMAFRFANGLFEPIWNRDRIDHVQITVAETMGVEQRGKFYEATGALRDMVPNHVFTLLSMVAMEPPASFEADSTLAKRAEVFAAMPAAKPERAVRGQYRAGTGTGRTGKGLPGRTERRWRFQYRDLRRDAAGDRQLALGRRALLLPHREEPGAANDGDCHPLQTGALRGLPGHRRRYDATELARAEHRPGREGVVAVRGKASRAGGRSCSRGDEVQL